HHFFLRSRNIKESSTKHQMGHSVNGQTGECTHNGAVDADPLQILAHHQLDLVGGLVGVPAFDGFGDDAGDLGGVVVGEEGGGSHEALVKVGAEGFVVKHPLTPAHGELGDLVAQHGVGVGGGVDERGG